MVQCGTSNKNRLRVRRVIDVPLREVCGICLRRGGNGRKVLVAVGHRMAKIAWFSQPRSRSIDDAWLTAFEDVGPAGLLFAHGRTPHGSGASRVEKSVTSSRRTSRHFTH